MFAKFESSPPNFKLKKNLKGLTMSAQGVINL